jgi:hypothetical protein
VEVGVEDRKERTFGMNHKEEEPTQGDKLSSNPTSLRGLQFISFPRITLYAPDIGI